MHPTISYCLAQARIADLRRHAQRDTLARAARDPGRRCRPGLRPWVLRPTRAVPGTALPRPFSPPCQATHPLAEPVPGIRPKAIGDEMAGAAHRGR